jgi:hypothetical protein
VDCGKDGRAKIKTKHPSRQNFLIIDSEHERFKNPELAILSIRSGYRDAQRSTTAFPRSTTAFPEEKGGSCTDRNRRTSLAFLLSNAATRLQLQV